MRTSRVILLAVGVVAVAAVAKKWFTPGDIYDPASTASFVESDPETP